MNSQQTTRDTFSASEKIINLPQDRFPGHNGEGIFFYHYAYTDGPFTGRTVLHSNAISLVISGEKTMRFKNKTLNANDRELHFISAGNCIASIQLSKERPFSSILIFFENKILTDFYLKNDELIRQAQNKRERDEKAYLTFPKDAFIRNYIDSLQLILANASTAMKLLKFEELMLYLLENYPSEILSFKPANNTELDDFELRKAVETNLTSNITLEELAFLCNMSLSTFKRRFKKVYGMPPNKWFMEQRMLEAKNLLQHHNEKPSEVYYKVGYENHSSFSKAFKQLYGITPKEFQCNC